MTSSERRPEAGVVSIPFGGGLVLLDQEAGRILAYNATAARIWDAAVMGQPARDMGHSLAQEYRIPLEQALQDVETILHHWRSEGLLPDSLQNDTVAQSVGEPCSQSESVPPFRRRTYRIRGQSFELAIAHCELSQRLEPLLRPLEADVAHPSSKLEACSSKGQVLILKENGIERLRTDSIGEMIGATFQAILELAYPDVHWLALVHGAAVLSGDGAILLPGCSGSGKSTLAAALVAQGYGYASDDLIALAAPEARVVPWPIPISVKRGSWGVLEACFPHLKDVRTELIDGHETKYLSLDPGAWNHEPSPVRALIFPTFHTTTPGRLQSLDPLDTLQRLLADRIWIGHPLREQPVRSFLQWLATIPAYAVIYRDLDQAHRCIVEALG